MKNLPKILKEHIANQNSMLGSTAKSGELNNWLNGQLKELKTANPELYDYIISRSKSFANGIMMVRDPYSIAVSLSLEYVLLLRLLDIGFGKEASLKKFTDMMDKWGLEGLNGL